VLPVLAYGLTPAFAAYPGSPSLRFETYASVLRDLLDSLYGQGFRRFLLVNGHGGNVPAAGLVREWAMDVTRPEAQAIFHSWWSSERVQAAAREVDPEPSHANWFENFPWTRLEGVDLPHERKPPLAEAAYRVADAKGLRELLGDGVFSGTYALPDERVAPVWQAGVNEVRELLESGWRSS
jgi:creatinine amidohydrolase